MATLTTLRADFFARGFDYLNDAGAGLARADRWINQGYKFLCEEENWPFLLTTAAGAAPLAIADLRAIYAVNETTALRRLGLVPEEELGDIYALATTGTPEFYYVDNGTVRTYPVGGTLSVRYYKVPADLATGADVALVPDRFTTAIVDRAVIAAGGEDAQDAVAAARAAYRDTLDLMVRSLLFVDGARHYQRRATVSLDD